jgi:hypothetical protein
MLNRFELVYKIGVSGEKITKIKEFNSTEDARLYLQMKSSRMLVISIKNLEL